MRTRHIRHLWLCQFAADVVAVAGAYYATVLMRFHSAAGDRLFTALNLFLGVREQGGLPEEFEIFYLSSAFRIILILTATLTVFYALGNLYPGRRFIRLRPVAWNVVMANAAALGIFYVYFYLRRNVYHPRSMFATILFLNAILCIGARGVVERVLAAARRKTGFDTWRAVLVGSTEEAGFLRVLVAERHPHGIDVVGQVDCAPDGEAGLPLARVEDSMRKLDADMLLVADKRLSINQLMQCLELGARLDAPVKVLSDKLAVLVTHARLPVDTVAGIPLVHFDAPSASAGYARWQAGVSRLAALAGGVVLLPVLGAIAALIRLGSPGPVFFIQERIGVNRRPFRMVKFRTMYDRADEMQAEVEELNESGKGLFKMRSDPRVTPIGRFLRRCSLDELPQLLNVIR